MHTLAAGSDRESASALLQLAWTANIALNAGIERFPEVYRPLIESLNSLPVIGTLHPEGWRQQKERLESLGLGKAAVGIRVYRGKSFSFQTPANVVAKYLFENVAWENLTSGLAELLGDRVSKPSWPPTPGELGRMTMELIHLCAHEDTRCKDLKVTKARFRELREACRQLHQQLQTDVGELKSPSKLRSAARRRMTLAFRSLGIAEAGVKQSGLLPKFG
jgi:hypothetical protein